jgi:hypothetical protein
VDEGAFFGEAAAEFSELGFAADEERRAGGELVDVLWGNGVLCEEKGFDLSEAVELVVAEVDVIFVAQEAGDGAIEVEDGEEFGLLVVGLLPEGVGPFFLDPVGVDGIGGEDEDDEVGIEALADFIDDVLAGEDFAFVEPDFHGGILTEEGGEFADEWFVFAGVAEEDGDHISGAFVMLW